MGKLRVALLVSVMVLSMFAFTRFIMPAAAGRWMRITVWYYKAYIYGDHDPPGGTGGGEWYFRLGAWYGGKWYWTSYAYCYRYGPGWCNFADRGLTWSFWGDGYGTDYGAYFRVQAREWDGYWDYTVTLQWYAPDHLQRGVWYYKYARQGDVMHYFMYKITLA